MGAGLAGQRLTLKLPGFATANQSQDNKQTASVVSIGASKAQFRILAA
jgi:hypothetical protein